MSELGSGNGTSYPSALDVDNTVEVDSSTTARADVPNDLAAAVIAVQTELGTDPAGSMTDIKTYLQTEHNTNGTHKKITLTGELIQKVGTDVSSATDLDITGDGNFFDVTGTTGISTMKSKGVGCMVVLQFDGICILTHNATNFDLGAAGVNITTAAGEVYTFYEYASADWRLVSRSTIAPATTFPAGIIILWSGAISAIPSGWVICDGNNSTPNLTARFVIHASADSGATYDVNDTGGSTTSGTHQLTVAEMPAHTHTSVEPPSVGADDGSGSPSGTGQATNPTSSTGGDGTHAHANTLPPYYALAYIMKS